MDLIDDNGRKRADIMEKRDYWDRAAHIDLITRFSISHDGDQEVPNNICIFNIFENRNRFFSSKAVELLSYEDRERYSIIKRERDADKELLDNKFPNWHNPGAYWDDLEMV